MELIYSKSIDKSVLCDGFSIKSIYLDVFTGITGKLAIGESKRIKLLFDGVIYDGIELKNQAFNRQKYPTHKEMYQVRYSSNSKFSQTLRIVYADVWQYIEQQQKIQNELVKQGHKRHNIKLPEDLHRTIAFYASNDPDIWIVEAYNKHDNIELNQSLCSIDELEYEISDNEAKIIEQTKLVKLRILDRKIGTNLKKIYSYRCQVCGESIGVEYGNNRIVDAHHIQPFTKFQNNNYNNIMILCPNHHRIIHNCHGEFKPSRKEIWYPNGLHEPLMLNKHL